MRDLSASPVGRVEFVDGHDRRFGETFRVPAFVPDPLPATIELSPECWMRLSNAMADLGRLDAAAALVPNPQLLTRVVTRREAVGTSALEGTYANLTDVFMADVAVADATDDQLPPNVREVVNYTRVAEAAYAWVVDRPVTVGLLESLQAKLVEGTAAEALDRGRLRTTQVFIGASNRRISDARFVPPPPGDHLRLMIDQWCDWINDDELPRRIQLIAAIALAHYQFETIHLFHDGNGRLGRLVAVLQLLRGGVLRAPVLSVSPWLNDHAQDYRDHLLEVSATGDWTPWVSFFAEAVSTQARDGHRRIMQLLALREQLNAEAQAALPRARLALEIAADLIASPILSISNAHSRYGRSNQANRDAVHQLVDHCILEPFSEERYRRLFWCPRVFQIIND